MKLHATQVLRPEQRQLLLPRLLQGVEILQVPSQDLAQWVQELAARNEAIAIKVEEPESGTNAETQPQEGADTMEYDRPRHAGPASGSESYDPVESAAAPGRNLGDELWEQAAGMDLSSGVKAAFVFLIESLDRNGHLKLSLEDVPRLAGGEVTFAAAEEALVLLRSLEPRGVGTGDAVECLLSQVDPGSPDMEELTEILAVHLEDIAQGHLSKVTRAMGISREKLELLLHRVRRLDPFPGRRFYTEQARRVFPDVLVRRLPEGGFEVQIEEQGIPKADISPEFLQRLADPSLPVKLRKELEDRLRSAKWLVESLGHRRQTLFRVAKELVERQDAFFREGPSALVPLKMEEVANVLNLHLSTISRTVADKWMECDNGVVPMRSLFDGQASATGGDSSRTAVRERIKSMVEAENPTAPFSDEEIVEKLALEGVRVARRTVAKYRSELDLPSSWKRRQV